MENNEIIDKKSLRTNAMVYTLSSIIRILSPIVVFPHVSRALGVDALGEYSYSSSIVEYFILIAEFGIRTYAVRECAKCRDDKNRFSYLASELFTINIISTMISYLLLFSLLFLRVDLRNEYGFVILVISLKMIFQTISVEWIFIALEEFKYISFRNIVIQLLSIVFILVFVRSKSDLFLYTYISVLPFIAIGVSNLFISRRIIRPRIVKRINLFSHINSLVFIFAMNLAITIYVLSDITILGEKCGDYYVGLYAVPSKIYSVAKTVLFSVLIVAIPRLSHFIKKHDTERITDTLTYIYKSLFTITIPLISLIIVLNREIILFFAGEEYLKSKNALVILALSLALYVGAAFWSQCVLIPYDDEKAVLIITVISALVNVLLNLLFVEKWNILVAALSTLVAEAITFIACYLKAQKHTVSLNIWNHFFKCIIGALVAGVIACCLKHIMLLNSFMNLAVSTILSLIAYFFMELFVGNENIKVYWKRLKNLVVFQKNMH